MAEDPNNWVESTADDGSVYYYNDVTGDTSWEKPLSPKLKHHRRRTYVEGNHDHLTSRAKGVPVEEEGEKVVFSDHVIRVDTVDNKGKEVTGTEEVTLVLTNRAVIEFPIGSFAEPTLRVPFNKIAGVSQSKECKLFYFKDVDKHNRRYYTDRAAEVIGVAMRHYTGHMRVRLPKTFNKEPKPDMILDSKPDPNKGKPVTLASAVGMATAVADFRMGFKQGSKVKICGYCNVEISASDTFRRHGEIYYHTECDPRERRKNSEAVRGLLQAKVKGKDPVQEEEKKKEQTEYEEYAKSLPTAAEARAAAQKGAEAERKAAEEALRAEMIRRYEEKKSKYTCYGCGQPFTGGHYYALLGKLWHQNCFSCTKCGTQLTDATGWFLRNREPVCAEHAARSKMEGWAMKAHLFLARNCKCLKLVDVTDGGGAALNKTGLVADGGGGASYAAGADIQPAGGGGGGDDGGLWYYVGDDGQAQGPVEASQMVAWFEAGQLQSELQVCRAGDTQYTTLSASIDAMRGGKKGKKKGGKKGGGGRGKRGGAAKKPKSKKEKQAAAAAAAAAEAEGGAESEWYYVDDDGNSQGPFTSSQISGWVDQGVLSEDRQISKASESGRWASISEQLDLIRRETSTSFASMSGSGAFGGSGLRDRASTTGSSSWYYIDENNQLQGPFPTAQILGWYDAGAMPGELQVRRWWRWWRRWWRKREKRAEMGGEREW